MALEVPPATEGGAVFWSNFFDSDASAVGGPYVANVLGDDLKQDSTWGRTNVTVRFLAEWNPQAFAALRASAWN